MRSGGLRGTFYSEIFRQAAEYGIDCKVYGAVCAISEIKNAIPLVHGPEGCAYYPKFFPPDAIRMKLLGEKDAPRIYTTKISEADVIYGGEEKLERAIIDVDMRERPDLIGVIGSCVPAIIGDDIHEVVRRVKERGEIKADVIATPSSGYEDERAEREHLDAFAKYTLNAWEGREKEVKFGIERCGRLDAIFSMVEQLTEDMGYKEENTVNIDTYGRLHYYEDLKGEIEEIKRILKAIGVRVNTVFPGCSVQDIKKMSVATLNFMRRSERAAEFMKKKYDTDYIFDPLCVKYAGLEGIERFFMDIASYFNLEGEAEETLSAEKRNLDARIAKIKQNFDKKNFSVVLVPLTTSLSYLKTLEYIGLNVKVLFINTEWLERFGTSREYAEKVAEKLAEHAQEMGIENVYINIDVFKEVEIARKNAIDLALIDTFENIEREMLYEKEHVNAFSPSSVGYSPFRISYRMTERLAEAIVQELHKSHNKKNLLIFKYKMDGWRFPCFSDILYGRMCWEELMKNVWRM